MTKAGGRLIKAAGQAMDIARGGKPAKMHVPADVDVKAIRERIGLSQDDFSAEFGFSLSQIRDWEGGHFRPLGSDRAYLMLIAREPDIVRQVLKDVRKDEGDEAREKETTLAI